MPAPSSARSIVGATIGGRYVVERELAGGGMGKILVARHRELGTSVALKLLRAERADEPVSVERFRREARAASHIRGEHVARVLDVGDSDEHGPFIVMEFVSGQSLAVTLAERGVFDIELAATYVLQACEAVADAHRLGIVHRDLKPSNLLLTEAPDGSELVKVTDFGIAKVPAMSNAQALTEAVGVLGSPRYMSPEQIIDPRTVDARSDLWSLGVVLYELVSGKVPFDAYTTSGILARIAAETATPLRTHLPSIQPAFEAVVMRCLEKAPAARFETVSELADALAPFARGGTERAARIRRIREAPDRRPLSSPALEVPIPPAAAADARAETLTSAPTARPVYAPRKSSRAGGRLTLFVGVVALAAVALLGVLRSRPPAKESQAAPSVAARPPESATVPPSHMESSSVLTSATLAPSAAPSASALKEPPRAVVRAPHPPVKVAPRPTADDLDFGPRK